MTKTKVAIVPQNRYFLRLKYFLRGFTVSVRPVARHDNTTTSGGAR